MNTGQPARTRFDSADDGALILRTRAGDEQAFAALYDRYSRVVYAVALRVVKDGGVAEDVLHDIFMQLWRHPEHFDAARGRLASWLAVIARNRAVDWVRRQRPQVDPEDTVLVSAVDVSSEVEREQILGKVKAVLQGMPEKQRCSLEMAFFDGLTHEEIARQTGEPLGTVKSRIRGAILAIRKALQ